MDKLILADIQALAASVDYGGSGFLQPASAALGLSAAFFLSNLNLWQGAGYSLTEAEIDDIQAMIAQLENDLTDTGDMYPLDMVKVSRTAPQAIPHFTDVEVVFDDEIYDPQGMHSNVVLPQRINVVTDGLYLITACIEWEGSSIGGRMMRIWRLGPSGTVKLAQSYLVADPGGNIFYQNLAAHDNAVVGDYYLLQVRQLSGITLDLLDGYQFPWFAAVRIAGS